MKRHRYSVKAGSWVPQLVGGESETYSKVIRKACRFEGMTWDSRVFQVEVTLRRGRRKRVLKLGTELRAGDAFTFQVLRRNEPVRLTGGLMGGTAERTQMLPFPGDEFALGEVRKLEFRAQRDFFLRRVIVSELCGPEFIFTNIEVGDEPVLAADKVSAVMFGEAALPCRIDVMVPKERVIRVEVERPNLPTPFHATIRLSRPKKAKTR